MARKVKWGVIGAGGIAARRTIPEFKKMVSNAEIVSVMDIAKRVGMKRLVVGTTSGEGDE